VTRTRLGPLVGDVLSYQSLLGPGTTFVAVGASGSLIAGTQLSVVPPVNAFWDVEAMIMLQKVDAAYHTAHGYLILSQPDANGDSVCYGGGTQHSAVDTYGCRTPRRTFKLVAGSTYNCQLGVSYDGGSWNYDQGPTRLWIAGTLYAR
jgi:hypothetical protein